MVLLTIIVSRINITVFVYIFNILISLKKIQRSEYMINSRLIIIIGNHYSILPDIDQKKIDICIKFMT